MGRTGKTRRYATFHVKRGGFRGGNDLLPSITKTISDIYVRERQFAEASQSLEPCELCHKQVEETFVGGGLFVCKDCLQNYT